MQVDGEDSPLPLLASPEPPPAGTPVSPYAATKRAGELAAFNSHHLYGLDVTSLRFFTVYGPRQRPEMAICAFIRAISLGQPLVLFGDEIGRAHV